MLEMELKFRVDDFEDVVKRLKKAGFAPGEPVEEKNLVLDMMGAPLGRMDTLFRLRNCGEGTLVTIKKPLPATALKVRLEQEAVLKCTQDEALKLFELLGYGVVYKYDKIRRECRIGDAMVCLDELWFGKFVEIESDSEDGVMRAVDLLGFDSGEGIRFSYAALEKDAEQTSDRIDG